MHSDETSQAKSSWVAKLNEKEGKIELEINDGVTYVGEIPVTSGVMTSKLIKKFQKGQVQILSKTTNKMTIEIGLIEVTLENSQTLFIKKMQQKIQQLQTKLATFSQWEEEDLNSTAQFDLNYEYRIKMGSTYSLSCVSVTADQIGYTYSYLLLLFVH